MNLKSFPVAQSLLRRLYGESAQEDSEMFIGLQRLLRNMVLSNHPISSLLKPLGYTFKEYKTLEEYEKDSDKHDWDFCIVLCPFKLIPKRVDS